MPKHIHIGLVGDRALDVETYRHTSSADSARKISWNNMGVEPGDQEGPGC